MRTTSKRWVTSSLTIEVRLGVPQISSLDTASGCDSRCCPSELVPAFDLGTDEAGFSSSNRLGLREGLHTRNRMITSAQHEIRSFIAAWNCERGRVMVFMPSSYPTSLVMNFSK